MPTLPVVLEQTCPQSHCWYEVQKLQQGMRAAQASVDGLWEWNLLTEEVWCSPRLLQILGRERGFASPTQWLDTLHPEDRDSAWSTLQTALATNESFETECRLATHDGSYHWFRARGSVYCDENGVQVYLSGALQPLDDLKRAQARLHEQECQLVQKQKMEAIGLLAGGVAHEFNNLLQSIRGYASFASETLTPDSTAYQDLEKVLRATDRATRLTRGLLDFSHSNPLETHSTALNAAIHESLQLLRPLLAETISLTAALAEQELFVNCEPQALQQLVLNLCINARDAMPVGGQLLVRSDVVSVSPRMVAAFPGLQLGWYARILISDTGQGITTGIREKIFEPFFTTKPIGEGSGLGLAIVHGIVRQCGGQIDFHSVPGRGTTFRVVLPLHQVPQVPAEWTIPSADLSGQTVLVALPDAAARNMGCRVLQRTGCHTLEAQDVSELRAQLQLPGVSVGLIVIDELLSADFQREAVGYLQADSSRVPACLCTRFDPQSSLCSPSPPVRAHLEYPLFERELIQVVSAVLQQNRESQAVAL